MTEPRSALVVWITGLPASGKSSLARALVDALRARGCPPLWLDSDAMREILTPLADYSARDRDAFYGVLASLAIQAARGGVPVVVSATAAQRRYRDAARRGVERFVEVWLRCDVEICRARDPKGLYRRAETGVVQELPGVQVVFEEPETPELVFDSGRTPTAQMLDVLLRFVDAHGLLAQ